MNALSRRKFFGLGAAAAVAGAAPLGFPQIAEAAPKPAQESPKTYFESIEKAIAFQNSMMDAYATGSTTRLIQSYSDQGGLESTAFTYDNAVSIHAYLLHGCKDSLERAEVLGNGLIYAQSTNFPFNDGRFAQAYFVNQEATDGSGAYITPAAYPFYFYTSAVGDQAWAGMALAQLYRRTGKTKYLTAALSVANWVVTNTYNTLGAGHVVLRAAHQVGVDRDGVVVGETGRFEAALVAVALDQAHGVPGRVGVHHRVLERDGFFDGSDVALRVFRLACCRWALGLGGAGKSQR